ncbi:MAG: hypothetical protein U0795_12480 [Pirellulales bacterium]
MVSHREKLLAAVDLRDSLLVPMLWIILAGLVLARGVFGLFIEFAFHPAANKLEFAYLYVYWRPIAVLLGAVLWFCGAGSLIRRKGYLALVLFCVGLVAIIVGL